MGKILSPHTVSKIVSLYLQGKSESDIAKMLGIDQSTVSKHKDKFKALAQSEDMKEAAEQYGVAEELEELHCLSMELRAAHLAVGECKAGFKMVKKFVENDIPQEEYANCIKALKRMSDEGFIAASIKLRQLEDSSGISCEEIVSQAAGSFKQLEATIKELQIVEGKLKMVKSELTNMVNQKMVASEDLKQHLQKVGADMHRIESVQELALALKESGATNKDTHMYLERQSLLNKSGISIDTFVQLLVAAKVLTAPDGGKYLLQKLNEYGGLDGAFTSLKQQEQVLTLSVGDLKAKAKLKGKLEAETVDLETSKADLEFRVSKLHTQKVELEAAVKGLQAQHESLAKQVANLKDTLVEKQKMDLGLAQDIASKKQNIVDLSELERRREALVAEVTQLEACLSKEKRRFSVSDAVMALVQSVPLAGMEALEGCFPALLEEARKGQRYSPEELRHHMLRELTGGTLRVLRCSSCDARFYVDKPAGTMGYQCPICSLGSNVQVDKDEVDLIKAAMASPGPGIKITLAKLPQGHQLKQPMKSAEGPPPLNLPFNQETQK